MKSFSYGVGLAWRAVWRIRVDKVACDDTQWEKPSIFMIFSFYFQ